MKHLLEIENVSKIYGNYTALKDISIQVSEGGIFGLLGPNGAGKTSLIRIINQITLPDQGQVKFDNEALSPKHISQIGYLPEERGLYKNMKVGEQALYLSRLKGLSVAEARQSINHWFARFDIAHWTDKKISELSKGMAQKVQFIITLLHKPKLIILDEPFSGFDPVNTDFIKKEILMLKEQGTTIILSTHRMESVEELCDDIALIHHSKVVVKGKLSEVRKQYKQQLHTVTLQTQSPDLLISKLNGSFSIIDKNFDSEEALLKLTVKNENDNNNQLIQTLSALAPIKHYKEIIPSVNDIFLQSVKEN